jgi:branched-chain amino acid transport system substrate-binding protein
MKKCRVLGSILLAAVLVVTMSLPAGAQGAKTIKIGVIGPMKYMQGKNHWNGALLAAEQINARGGVQVGNQKMRIELVRADSNEANSITDATNAMERLITKDKVKFVVGGFRTEAVLPMQDIACEHKVIFFGCGAADAQLCNRLSQNYDLYKYWFRYTPFSSPYLVKMLFNQFDNVAAIIKETLNVPKLKVAVVTEKALWADTLTKMAELLVVQKGMELVGTWRPSAKATDVTAELSAIQRSGAHIIFTAFSDAVGITFVKQAGELKIPAAIIGTNVEATSDSFWKNTQGKANYTMTSASYCPGVESTEFTKAFVEGYTKRFGETPNYPADTYSAIYYALVPAIEKTGTLDPDKLVAFLETYEHKNSVSNLKYINDTEGKPIQEIAFGPGYATGIAVQWVDGKEYGIWPYKWKMTPSSPVVTYKGVVKYKVPPLLIQKYRVNEQ